MLVHTDANDTPAADQNSLHLLRNSSRLPSDGDMDVANQVAGSSLAIKKILSGGCV